jgi:hypothetical protein
VGASKYFSYFQGSSLVESHHEYMFEETLKNTVLFRMGKLKLSDLNIFFENSYGKSLKKCKQSFWVDSSNALPWGLEALLSCFPNAKFVHLIRDGRKVVSSFYNKFESEMYPLEGLNKLKHWIENDHIPSPQPDKKIWRPLPNFQKDKITYSDDLNNRFAMLCWYWSELNTEINDFSKKLKSSQFYFIKFEDFISSSSKRSKLLEFIGLEDITILSQDISKPLNVSKPMNYNFSNNQAKIFDFICASTNTKFGYDGKSEMYDVKY